MNSRYYLGLLIVLFSCGKIPQEGKVKVSYEMVNYKIASKLICENDISCAYYEVNYPKFSGLDSAVTRTLDAAIDASVSMGNPESEGKAMQQIGAEFVKDYEEFSNGSGGKEAPWFYKAQVNVEVLSDSLISLSTTEEFYTGGAHGGMGKYFINVNPTTGQQIKLENFLKPGYEQALTTLGDKYFRQERNLIDTASLDKNYFEFPNNTFQLNQNYGFTKEGIVFYYNSYEVAAYAAGPTEVVIPYESLKGWLR